jgi:hypothetical protein
MRYRGSLLHKTLFKGPQLIRCSAGHDFNQSEAVPDPAFQAVFPRYTVDKRTKPDTLYHT